MGSRVSGSENRKEGEKAYFHSTSSMLVERDPGAPSKSNRELVYIFFFFPFFFYEKRILNLFSPAGGENV